MLSASPRALNQLAVAGRLGRQNQSRRIRDIVLEQSASSSEKLAVS